MWGLLVQIQKLAQQDDFNSYWEFENYTKSRKKVGVAHEVVNGLRLSGNLRKC